MKRYMQSQVEAILSSLKIQLLHIVECTIWSTITTPIVFYILAFFGFVQKVFLYDVYVFFAIVLLVSIDTVVGMKKWLKLKKFNEKKIPLGAFEKLFLCVVIMLLFNVIGLKLEGHTDLQNYMSLFSFMIVISYPAGSIIKNTFFISNGKFPPIGFMRKWDNYENTADVETIFKTEAAKNDTIVPPIEEIKKDDTSQADINQLP